MNSAPISGLAIITSGNSNTFTCEGNHIITASFSISNNGVPLFTVLLTGITFNVSLNNISDPAKIKVGQKLKIKKKS